jgi:hypothetical protein
MVSNSPLFCEVFPFIILLHYPNYVAGITPDTHLLHLKVGVYIFFHRLYAMYPNNTVAFMKSFYESNHGKDVHRSIEVFWLIGND